MSTEARQNVSALVHRVTVVPLYLPPLHIMIRRERLKREEVEIRVRVTVPAPARLGRSSDWVAGDPPALDRPCEGPAEDVIVFRTVLGASPRSSMALASCSTCPRRTASIRREPIAGEI